MTHIFLHFSLGASSGMLAGIFLLRRALSKKGKAAWHIGTWIAMSYLAGIWAALPNVMIPPLTPGGWSNIFLLHDLVSRCFSGGALTGAMGITGIFTLQYAVLLIFVLILRRKNRTATTKNT